MKERRLVIGYGNRLRGDDGVGWEVASRLAAAVPSEAAHILTVHQLTPELAEPVSEADLVIFIDASRVGEPGTWRCDHIKPVARPATRSATTSTLPVCSLTRRPSLMPVLGRSLFQWPPNLLISGTISRRASRRRFPRSSIISAK